MRNMNKIFMTLGAITWLSHCTSLSNYDTAFPLNKGSGRAVVAATSSPSLLDKDKTWYVPEVEYRKSLGEYVDNLDVGVKVFPIGGIVYAQYPFVKSQYVALAGNLGFSYAQITSGDNKATLVDLLPMVLFTVRPISWFDVTLAPRVISRFIVEGGSGSSLLYGGSANFRLGSDGFGVIPQVGYFLDKEKNGTLNFGAGIYF